MPQLDFDEPRFGARWRSVQTKDDVVTLVLNLAMHTGVIDPKRGARARRIANPMVTKLTVSRRKGTTGSSQSAHDALCSFAGADAGVVGELGAHSWHQPHLEERLLRQFALVVWALVPAFATWARLTDASQRPELFLLQAQLVGGEALTQAEKDKVRTNFETVAQGELVRLLAEDALLLGNPGELLAQAESAAWMEAAVQVLSGRPRERRTTMTDRELLEQLQATTDWISPRGSRPTRAVGWVHRHFPTLTREQAEDAASMAIVRYVRGSDPRPGAFPANLRWSAEDLTADLAMKGIHEDRTFDTSTDGEALEHEVSDVAQPHLHAEDVAHLAVAARNAAENCAKGQPVHAKALERLGAVIAAGLLPVYLARAREGAVIAAAKEILVEAIHDEAQSAAVHQRIADEAFDYFVRELTVRG